MHGGHETLNDGEAVVDDLSQGSQAVGGAGSIADDIVLLLVLLLVDAHDKHGGVGRWGRDDDLLGTSLQVSGSLLDGGEAPGGLHDILGSVLGPGDGSRVLAVINPSKHADI